MTLREIMVVADKGYPDGMVWLYFADPKGKHGDTLAEFIVRELRDTFDPDASDMRQIMTAAKAIQSAAKELEGVSVPLVRALEDMAYRTPTRKARSCKT